MSFSPSNIKSIDKKPAEKEKQKENQIDSFLNDFTETGSVRTGPDFQAEIPPFNENDRTYTIDERSALLWSPPENLSSTDYHEYVVTASKEFKYSLEQALGFLQWHNHDVSLALKDLPHYVPVSDEWSGEDILVFEQAFSFNGKCFHRIQQMLPNKTMASLVKFYYSWKKRAAKESSHIDFSVRSDKILSDEDISNGKSATSNGHGAKSTDEKHCINCNSQTLQLYRSPLGNLCNTCFMYFRRTGNMREISTRKKHASEMLEERETEISRQRNHKAPKNINLNSKDFMLVMERSRRASNAKDSHETVGPSSSTYLYNSDKDNEKLVREIRLLRERAYKNRFALSQLRKACAVDIGPCRPPLRSDSPKTNHKWSEHEIMLALQGFRMFGKKFHCISELIETKTVDHVRSFFNSNRLKYDIDSLIKDLEHQKRVESEANEGGVVVLNDEDRNLHENDVVTIDD